MADIIRGEPGDLCDGESAACHSALEQLRGVFLNIGFNAEKKRDREATLRVYPSKDVHHPLLNPRFRRCSIDGVPDFGCLVITVISKEDHQRWRRRLQKFPDAPGCFFIPDGRRTKEYTYEGHFVIPVEFPGSAGCEQIDFKALSKPLGAIFDFFS